MLVPPHRHGWIDECDGRAVGMVSVRGRLGSDVWDIEQLIIANGKEGRDAGTALLHTVSDAAANHGIQKVFLRLESDNKVVDSALRAGFYAYTGELLFRINHAPRDGEWLPPPFRPRRPSDHQALFQMYNALVPAEVRSVEGMTLQEWRWSDGWGLRPVNWITKHLFVRQDFVIEEEGAITAWLKVERHNRTMELLWMPGKTCELNEMMRFGALVLGYWMPCICVVRSFQNSFRLPLESLGFRQVGEHHLLVRSLLARVHQTRLMPVGI
jgi:hypothetical protein